jgi:hypothetical protein
MPQPPYARVRNIKRGFAWIVTPGAEAPGCAVGIDFACGATND